MSFFFFVFDRSDGRLHNVARAGRGRLPPAISPRDLARYGRAVQGPAPLTCGGCRGSGVAESLGRHACAHFSTKQASPPAAAGCVTVYIFPRTTARHAPSLPRHGDATAAGTATIAGRRPRRWTAAATGCSSDMATPPPLGQRRSQAAHPTWRRRRRWNCDGNGLRPRHGDAVAAGLRRQRVFHWEFLP